MKRLLILLLVSSLVLCGTASAIGIGVSPGRVEFDSVLRNGYAERTVKISTDSDSPIGGVVRVEPELQDWISFRPNVTSFAMTSENPYELTIIITPPTDTPTGNYSGLIEIITDAGGEGIGRAGGVIKTAVVMAVDVEVSGDEFIECRAGGFRIRNIEENFPVDVELNVINDGNVRLSPSVSVDVYDQLQENLVTSTTLSGKEILPTTQQELLLRFDSQLDQGQYWATVRVEECNVEQLLTFSVVEQGGIVDVGELRSIIVRDSIELGQTAQVLANFVNKGPRAVNARFDGVVRRDDVLITQLQSDEVIVPSGEEVNIQTFFQPFDPGRYVLSGRVVYNKKLTFEKSAVLTAYLPDAMPTETTWVTLLIFIALLMTILFMLRKIFNEQRKKRQRHSGHHHPHQHHGFHRPR